MTSAKTGTTVCGIGDEPSLDTYLRADVDRLEQFMARQSPAATPWEPITDYSVDARRRVEARRPRLILETFAPSSLLDVGCGYGHLLKFLEELQPGWPHRFHGLDIMKREPWLGREGSLLIDDITALSPGHQQYELVICREMLEHLTIRQIVAAIPNLIRLSARYIYLTTRFHLTPRALFDIRDHDEVDPSHITVMPKALLRALFVLHGCKTRHDLEVKMDWGPNGRTVVFEVPGGGT